MTDTVAPPGEHAGAIRGVDLVAGEGDIVDVPGGQVDAAVRCELRRVKSDSRSVPARHCDDLSDRPHVSGDIGRPRDDDEAVPGGHLTERGVQIPYAVRHRRGDPEGHGAVRSPRQQRRVMLGRERDHGRVGREGVGEQGPRVGRIAGEDDVIGRPRSYEPADLLTGLVIPLRGDPARVAVAAVHRPVARDHSLDGRRHTAQGGGRRRVVEVRVVDPPVGHGHLEPIRGGGRHAGAKRSRCFESRGHLRLFLPTAAGSRLPTSVAWTRSSSGAPRREEGCRPASRS